jgi:hypothetical protein
VLALGFLHRVLNYGIALPGAKLRLETSQSDADHVAVP